MISCWNNSKELVVCISCFNRCMHIIFKDFPEYNEQMIRAKLTENYYDWHDLDTDYCCEEYILNELPDIYKNNIICVIYEGDDEDE